MSNLTIFWIRLHVCPTHALRNIQVFAARTTPHSLHHIVNRAFTLPTASPSAAMRLQYAPRKRACQLLDSWDIESTKGMIADCASPSTSNCSITTGLAHLDPFFPAHTTHPWTLAKVLPAVGHVSHSHFLKGLKNSTTTSRIYMTL